MKTRIIPENSLKIDVKGTNAVIYLYSDNLGRPCAKGYAGRKIKPHFNCWFRSIDARLEYINRWIKGVQEQAAINAERNKPHTIQVGDIFKASWGYEQTNIDYYECIRVMGTFIEVREINREIIYNNEMMTGKCAPLPGSYQGDAFRCKVSDNKYIKVRGHTYASLMTPEIVGGAKVYPVAHYTDYA